MLFTFAACAVYEPAESPPTTPPFVALPIFVTYFPKIYYRMKQGLLHIRVEITLGKYQEQLLNLEKKLESGLYCELTDKELKDSYVEYTLLYDTIANRISIEDVQAKDGRLRLMENVWWEYDKLPHMLIAGGTGGGKTYFILTLIEALLRSNAVMYVLDPKNAVPKLVSDINWYFLK
jgi:DNA segregation ATPase FtsK/SpoIIIE-like protein